MQAFKNSRIEHFNSPFKARYCIQVKDSTIEEEISINIQDILFHISIQENSSMKVSTFQLHPLLEVDFTSNISFHLLVAFYNHLVNSKMGFDLKANPQSQQHFPLFFVCRL